jgi:hypothetical protein
MAGQALRRLMAEYKRKFHQYHLNFSCFSHHKFFGDFTQNLKLFNFILELTLNPPEGIIAGPISEENFFEWEALISGPTETVFEGE